MAGKGSGPVPAQGMISQATSDRNWKRLTAKYGPSKKQPDPPPTPKPAEYPTAVMQVSGPDLQGATPKVIFKLKHGVWFWHAAERPLYRLDQWGDTLCAVERMCRRLNFTFRWLVPPDNQFLTAPDVRGATHGLTA